MTEDRSRACPVCQTVVADPAAGTCPACGMSLDDPGATQAISSEEVVSEETAFESAPQPTETMPFSTERIPLETEPIRTREHDYVYEQLVSPERTEVLRESRLAAAPPWYQQRNVILGAAALALLIAILLIVWLSGRDEPTELAITSPTPPVATEPIGIATASATPATPTLTPAPTPQPIAAPGTTTDPTPTPMPAQGWTTVTSLSGTGDNRGPVFELTGNAARLRYTVQGSNQSQMSAWVIPEGQTREGRPPVVQQEGQAEDERTIEEAAGRYFLDVTSSNARWSITIEEYR